jgi:Tol biopolymer transport system component
MSNVLLLHLCRPHNLFPLRHPINSDGTAQTKLTNFDTYMRWQDQDPAWSPDGSKIAFSENQGGVGVSVVNADGTAQHNLTNDGAYDRDPAWSP